MSLVLLGAAGSDEPDPAIVGAKAAGLSRMANAGLPVPPGFVLGTDLCAAYHAGDERFDTTVRELVTRGIRHLERATGLRFGAARRPLLVSVRSGAAVSMPGMLDTVLDVGLSDTTAPGLLRATGDPAFVWDSYRRLVQCYAEVVDGVAGVPAGAEDVPATPFAALVEQALRRYGVPEVAELDVAALRELVGRLLEGYRSAVGRPFPQDPTEQLTGAITGVFESWNSARAVEYRRLAGLTGLAGTAVTVQAMVFGNRGLRSGSGVAFTRDPATGEPRRYLDFLLNAQGEDVVAGRRRMVQCAAGGSGGGPLAGVDPGLPDRLDEVCRTLETVFGDAQDIEFTVEEGTLWVLQSRAAQRTPWAALRIACDLVAEGLIDRRTALDRLRDHDLDHIVRYRLAGNGIPRPLGHATPAGAGVVAGPVALDAVTATAYARRGERAVLVRSEASTDDIAALAVCGGLLTAGGARTSHAAVVARQLGVVCLVGCAELAIDADARRIRIGDRELRAGEAITLDGADGSVYPGALDLVEERPTELIDRVRGWQRALAAG